MKSPYGDSGYGREQYQPYDGISRFQQMRDLLALKWVRETQPAPVVKFTGTTAKVRMPAPTREGA